MSEPQASETRQDPGRLPVLLGLAAAALALLAIVLVMKRDSAAGDQTPPPPAATAKAQAPPPTKAVPQRGMTDSDAKSEIERARELRRKLGIEPAAPAPTSGSKDESQRD